MFPITAATGAMSSLQTLKDFVSERLSVAAGEIFSVFERTIVQYEERRDDVIGRPRLQDAEKSHMCKEEQLWNQDEPELSGWKDEEEEVCSSRLAQHSASFLPVERGSEHRGAQAITEQLFSHNSVRSFINVRLSAAAGEIFNVFEQTIVRYDEERDGHPRVLVTTETVHTHLHGVEKPQNMCKEEQLWNHENPEPSGCKEEEEQEESDYFLENPGEEDSDLERDSEELLSHNSVTDLTSDQLNSAADDDDDDDDYQMLEPSNIWSDPQHPQLNIILIPQMKSQGIDRPRQHASKENQLCCQDRSSSLCSEEAASPLVKEEQEKSTSPQIKEEQEERWITVDGEQLLLRRVTDDSIQTDNESHHGEAKSKLILQRNQHSNIHNDEKPYSCSECHKGFNQKNHLIVHKRIHAVEKPYSCSECGKSFIWQSALITHKRKHTGEKPYTCSVCSRSFTWQSAFITHKQSHTGEKPYSCSECSKSFSQKSSLIMHQQTHTGEGPYPCPQCSKSFIWKSTLVCHMRSHTDEKPYSCSECNKSFRQKTSLNNHMLSHTGERPYSCSECNKSFTRKDHMITHMQTHTGEKPYSCSDCGKCFSQNSTLISHKRTHTAERPYSCSECGKCFSQNSTLNRHKKTHAGEKPSKMFLQ